MFFLTGKTNLFYPLVNILKKLGNSSKGAIFLVQRNRKRTNKSCKTIVYNL